MRIAKSKIVTYTLELTASEMSNLITVVTSATTKDIGSLRSVAYSLLDELRKGVEDGPTDNG